MQVQGWRAALRQRAHAWRAMLAQTLLVLATLLLGLLGLLLLRGGGSVAAGNYDYLLIIDAGSTGTRMNVYRWLSQPNGMGLPQLELIPPHAASKHVPLRANGDVRAYHRVETEPGLDSFVGDLAGIRTQALGPLLRWAQAVVPQRQWASTPALLLGTGGLRSVGEEAAWSVLASVREVLAKSGFRFKPRWARVMRGVDEGVYGWISVNYMQGRLGPHALPDSGGQLWPGWDSVGTIDLGGSSLEVSFVPPPGQQDVTDLVNVSLGGVDYLLYAHTHARYGLNDAWDRSVELLLPPPPPPPDETIGDGVDTSNWEPEGEMEPLPLPSPSPDPYVGLDPETARKKRREALLAKLDELRRKRSSRRDGVYEEGDSGGREVDEFGATAGVQERVLVEDAKPAASHKVLAAQQSEEARQWAAEFATRQVLDGDVGAVVSSSGSHESAADAHVLAAQQQAAQSMIGGGDERFEVVEQLLLDNDDATDAAHSDAVQLAHPDLSAGDGFQTVAGGQRALMQAADMLAKEQAEPLPSIELQRLVLAAVRGSAQRSEGDGAHGVIPGTGATSLRAKLLEGTAGTAHTLTEAAVWVPKLQHPCLHAGYQRPYTRQVRAGVVTDPPEVLLIGRPSWPACMALVEQVLGSAYEAPAPDASNGSAIPHALGAKQPLTHGRFVALSGFHVVHHWFGLPPGAPLSALLEAGQRHCGTPWEEVAAARGSERSVEQYCFRVPFVLQLLIMGLGLREDSIDIGDGSESWTLGAALAEGFKLGAFERVHGAAGGVVVVPGGGGDVVLPMMLKASGMVFMALVLMRMMGKAPPLVAVAVQRLRKARSSARGAKELPVDPEKALPKWASDSKLVKSSFPVPVHATAHSVWQRGLTISPEHRPAALECPQQGPGRLLTCSSGTCVPSPMPWASLSTTGVVGGGTLRSKTRRN